MDGIRQSVLDLLQGWVTHCMLPGRTPEYPANSCTELAEQLRARHLLRELLDPQLRTVTSQGVL